VFTSRYYHEAAHAVFAYHDSVEVDEVWVFNQRGQCTISEADHCDRDLPWEYAKFCLAGAYAAHVAMTLEHPQLEQMPLSGLREDAQRVYEGDAWWAVHSLEDYASTEGFPFGSIEEAYAALIEELWEAVEERWAEIEGLSFALRDKYWESGEEKAGRLDSNELTRIIEYTRSKNYTQGEQMPPSVRMVGG
jgi:hypothetical protein